jgi:heme-degrading monooxygenase HmoA
MSQAATIYRVDKFVVPASAREEFLRRVLDTHQVLRRQPGFVRDSILEQVSGPGRFNIVTVAEWQDQASIDAARAQVLKAQAESGFNPQETIARLGIETDIATYKPLGA